jgi:hypothetical protein
MAMKMRFRNWYWLCQDILSCWVMEYVIQYYFETEVHQHSDIVNILSRYRSIPLPQQLNQILWYIQNEEMLPANLIIGNDDSRKHILA